MKSILITISAAAMLAYYCTGEEPAKTPAAPTIVVTLSYVPVSAVQEILRSAFPEIDDVVASVDVDANTLTLNTAAPKFAKIREILAVMDKRPEQIKIEMEITEVDAAGNEAIVSRPVRYSIAGKEVEISLGKHDGKQLKRSIKATPLSEDEQEALMKK